MDNKNGQQKPQVDVEQALKLSTPLVSASGNQVFGQGIIFRKVSKFVVAQDKDAIIPIDVFYDLKTGEILTEMLPIQLRAEYETYNKNLNPKPEVVADPIDGK